MNTQVQTYCYTCDSKTFHTSLFFKKVQGEDKYDTPSYYMVLQCGGCRSVSFLLRSENPNAEPGDEDEFFDMNYSGNADYDEDEFRFLREKDFDLLPAKIRKIYEEVEITLEYEAPITAGIALRTLVEAICLDQQMPGRNLQEKIRNLQTQGLISLSELPILDKLRLIGNQSTHEIKSFPIEKLYYALEIVNHVLVSVFILPKINKKLKI